MTFEAQSEIERLLFAIRGVAHCSGAADPARAGDDAAAGAAMAIDVIANRILDIATRETFGPEHAPA
jgi:hypothetical protein